jgi:uncharacterized protein YjiK
MRSLIIYIITALFTLLPAGKIKTYLNQNGKDYDLSSPDIVFKLPDILLEISGITYIDQNTVGCIQDEDGILFMYNISNEKITNQKSFHKKGDYEGIARVDKTIYVLRSDGTLFEIRDFESSGSVVTSYKTGIPAKDNEGLCYDQKNNRLLIGCKSRAMEGEKYKNKRQVYSFSLKTKTLSIIPLLTFDVKVIGEFGLKNNLDIPVKEKKDGKVKEADIRFETSDIAIHPLTGKLYLLSSSDKLLFVFNMNGTIENIEKLKNQLFPQPEGITFLPNGDMLISNEGQDKKGTILRFNYK